MLKHPAFDRAPVVNLLRPGPKRGVVSLAAARRRGAVHDLSAEVAGSQCAPAERATIAAALKVLGSTLRRPGAVLDSPGRTRELLALHLAGRQREGFGALFVSSRYAVIEFAMLFDGTLPHTAVHRRELVRRALLLNAAGVILAHNHSSGLPEPSRADELMTRAIKAALALVGVVVLDHVIVGRLSAVSMAERGMV
ncbi:MAG: JAB domain-containing protein [Rubrivivax sp.]